MKRFARITVWSLVVMEWLVLGGCSTTPDIVLRNSAGKTARCEGFFVAS